MPRTRPCLPSRSMTGGTISSRPMGPARRAAVAALLAAGLVGIGVPPAAAEWRLQAATGAAHSLTTPLSIEQHGFPELRIDAEYDNRPFDSAPYFMLRVSRRSGTAAWELQHLHHKIYLSNLPPEVE